MSLINELLFYSHWAKIEDEGGQIQNFALTFPSCSTWLSVIIFLKQLLMLLNGFLNFVNLNG